MADEFDPYSKGVEYQVTKVDPTDPTTKGAVYQVHKVDEVTAAMSGKFYRARVIKDPDEPTVKGKVYQIVIIDDPDDPSVKGKVYNAIITGDQEAVVVGPAVPPLDLDSAVADTLTYVKAYGGTKLSYDIPLEYTQVDGAIKWGNYSTDGKFDTVVKITTDDVKIEVIVKAGNMEQQSGQNTMGSFYACQARAANGSTITGISGSTNGNTILGTVGSAVITSQLNGQDRERIPNHIYLIRHEYKNGTQTLYVKDLTDNNEDTQTGTYTFSAPTSNFYIFGNSATTNRVNGGNTIYSCKIWNAGTLVFDAVSVKRDSDNAVGLYDSIRNRFIEPIGRFDAGDVTTPTPSDPIDLVCNNGKISVLDHTNWNVITNPTSQTGQGMFINSDGKLQKANDRGAGVFIPITIGKQYTVLIDKKTTALGRIIRYGQSNNGDLPNSAEQLLDWYRGAIEDIMMISFTAKRPYFVMQLAASFVEAGGIDEAVEVLEAAGDNETIAIDGTRYIDPSDCVIGKYIDNSGAIATNAANYYCNTYFAVEPNTTYTMKTESDVWSFNIAEYDSGKTFIQRTLDPTPHGNKTEFSITTSATTRFIRVGNNTSPDGGTSNPTTLAIIQSLKPRIDGIHCSATANNLFAVNTYKDEQEIITGTVKHKVNVYVLNGEETAWNDVVSSSSYAMPKTALGSDSNVLPNKSTDVICSHYSVASTESGTGVQDIIWVGGSNVNFKTKSTYATLADWKDYLAAQYAAGTPVIVIVPFATEYSEPAPIAQTMQTTAGDNTLDIVQAGMSGLEVEAKYTKGG